MRRCDDAAHSDFDFDWPGRPRDGLQRLSYRLSMLPMLRVLTTDPVLYILCFLAFALEGSRSVIELLAVSC